MTAEDPDPPEDLSEFVERHRDAAERHAEGDKPASWLTEQALSAVDTEESREGVDDR